MDVIDKPKEANVAKAANEVSPDDLFKNEFNDLEDDFNKQMFNDKAQNLPCRRVSKKHYLISQCTVINTYH